MVEIIYLIVILGLLLYFYLTDRSKIKTVRKDFFTITYKNLPFVLFIIIITCIMKVYIPQDTIVHYLGKDNKYLAPILSAFFASFFEGPIIVAFVIGLSLFTQGASIAATVSFISAFSMVGMVAIPLEKEQLGKAFAFVRYGLTFIFSVIIGFTCEFIHDLT